MNELIKLLTENSDLRIVVERENDGDGYYFVTTILDDSDFSIDYIYEYDGVRYFKSDDELIEALLDDEIFAWEDSAEEIEEYIENLAWEKVIKISVRY